MNTRPALILIDIQKGFKDSYYGVRNNPLFEENVVRILDHWRKNHLPIIHVQHHSSKENSPLRPDREGVQFMEIATPFPSETIFTKKVNSAFIGTGLEMHLREQNLNEIVLVGLTTDHCISTTARMGANLNFKTTVVHDSTATFNRSLPDGTHFEAETVHRVALASLNKEFASVRSTLEMICKPY